MLATDVVLCEDGHAQERSLLDQIVAIVAAKDLWIADRNFCTTDFLFGIARRGGFFVIRQHASTLHWEFVGKRRACGRIDTGKVFEQTIRATNDAGEILILRRVTVLLDQPTRDGETELHLLTNVPAKDARAEIDRRFVPASAGRSRSPTDTTPQGDTCHGPPEPVRVAASALLNLARWCRQRLQTAPKEDASCPAARPALIPPASTDPARADAQGDAPTVGHPPRTQAASPLSAPGPVDGPNAADRLRAGGQQ